MAKMWMIAALLTLSASVVFSQGDSTRYINGMPVSDDDTVQNFPQRDLAPVNRLSAVALSELPAEVREALEEGSQYDGWRDSTVYFQKNTGLYIVPVKYEGGVKIFGLNERGEPMTYSEVDDNERPRENTGDGRQ